jgi:hypothetical protein
MERSSFFVFHCRNLTKKDEEGEKIKGTLRDKKRQKETERDRKR